MQLDALTDALDANPKMLILQPRAHNPSGVSVSQERAKAIADLLPADVWVIEDDHSGDASGAELHSIAALRPDQSVFIWSFSKSHGPDLRIAAIGGAAAPLRTLERRRSLGPSWTSRLLQQILLEMLIDDQIERDVAAAAATYQTRRKVFATKMAEHGVDLAVGAGINMAIPVHDEQLAVVYLAAHSIGAAPGTPFLVDPVEQDFVRLSIGNYDGDLDELAAVVAASTRAGLDL